MFGKWNGHVFSSGPTTGRDFRDFSKEFKAILKKTLPSQITVEKFNPGHYILSGFLYNNKTDKWCYISLPDVRWHLKNKVMIRAAENPCDYTGGNNNWVTFEEVGNMALKLTA